MEKQPSCRKCGRRLKSPMSIARGMGATCAGLTATFVNNIGTSDSGGSRTKYKGAGSSHLQTLLFPGDLPGKRLSTREVYSKRRSERRQSFELRKRFQCGLLLPRRKPLIYTPLDDGSWRESPSGRVISHQHLQEYLKQYKFI
jgi:hypothetical protein